LAEVPVANVTLSLIRIISNEGKGGRVTEANSEFSDYIVFVDESGSPTLSPLDPDYPIFVLAFCIINKWAYINLIEPAVARLKFEFFGHDLINLHAWEIRRAKGEFRMLQNAERRGRFMESLSRLMTDADFYTVAWIVDKRLAKGSPQHLMSSYQVSFSLALAYVSKYLDAIGETDKLVHVIAEARGQKENKELYDHFSLILQDHSPVGLPRFDLKIVPKVTGLQLADLCAYPIGRYYLSPDHSNRPFEIIKNKTFIGLFP
jgi:Protein of unknown function (DUF3800)